MSGFGEIPGTHGAAGPDQRVEVLLPAEEFAALGAALGVSEPLSRPGLHDVDGTELVRHGTPLPEVQALLAGFTDQRGQVMLTRFRPDGMAVPHLFWLSRHGVLAGAPADDRPAGEGPFRLRLHAGGALHRLLIDAAGLSPRPAPRRGFEPVPIPLSLLDRTGSGESDGETAREARREMGDRIADVAPEAAEELRAEAGDVTVLTADWDGAEGHRGGQVIWVDTVAGMVLHTVEQAFLRARHQLEPAPAWVVWSHIVATIPTLDDVDWWFRQDAESAD